MLVMSQNPDRSCGSKGLFEALAFCAPCLPFCAKETGDESTTVIAIIARVKRPGILELLIALRLSSTTRPWPADLTATNPARGSLPNGNSMSSSSAEERSLGGDYIGEEPGCQGHLSPRPPF